MAGEFDDASPDDAWRVEVPDLRRITLLMPTTLYDKLQGRMTEVEVDDVIEYLRRLVAMDVAGLITDELWKSRKE